MLEGGVWLIAWFLRERALFLLERYFLDVLRSVAYELYNAYTRQSILLI